jgi:hypothetical protein
MRWSGARTVTVPRTRTSLPRLTLQASTTMWSGRFSSTVAVAASSSPAAIEPSNASSCDTSVVPGPGMRRASRPEMIASAPAAFAVIPEGDPAPLAAR